MSENLDKIGSILDIFSYDSTSTLQPNLSFFFAFPPPSHSGLSQIEVGAQRAPLKGPQDF